MQKNNLQEILELLQQNFPKVPEKSLIKIIFSLKARDSQFDFIWFSRLECGKYWIWEQTLQRIIYFLRNFWLLELKGKRLRSKGTYLCNIYKLSDDFVEMFRSLEFFTKKIFEYIDPITFMKRFFSYKLDNIQKCYRFKDKEWNKYLIALKWRFAGKIYWLTQDKIINPYELMQT